MNESNPWWKSRRTAVVAGVVGVLVVIGAVVAIASGDDSTDAKDGRTTTTTASSNTTTSDSAASSTSRGSTTSSSTTSTTAGGASSTSATNGTGSTPATGPGTTAKTPDTALTSLESAYNDGYTAECKRIWAYSRDGKLYDPDDTTDALTIDTCMESLDPGFVTAKTVPAAGAEGRQDARDFLSLSTTSGLLCWINPSTEAIQGCYNPETNSTGDTPTTF